MQSKLSDNQKSLQNDRFGIIFPTIKKKSIPATSPFAPTKHTKRHCCQPKKPYPLREHTINMVGKTLRATGAPLFESATLTPHPKEGRMKINPAFSSLTQNFALTLHP